MFGQNPVRKQDEFPFDRLRVQHVFDTIQGEGPFAGHPAIFVRMAGCNLRCTFCDTDFESGWANVMSPQDLFNLVDRYARSGKNYDKTQLVVVTGGEPLLQGYKGLSDFVRLLTEAHYHVQFETSGTRALVIAGGAPIQEEEGPPEPGAMSFVVSPKTPALGGAFASFALAFKYIVSANDADPEDGLPIFSTQPHGPGIVRTAKLARPPEFRPGLPVYVQPKDVPDPGERAANVRHAVDIAIRYGYRLSVQVHKIVGVD